tara:strand:+ start:23563 stop:24585 length:1023 start_codon:yes stop_codon:yes gene_type:complete
MPQVINIEQTTIHRIDLQQPDVGENIHVDTNNDFHSYVEKLVEEIFSSSRSKAYKFQMNLTTEVANQIHDISDDNWLDIAQVIAERLFKIEKLTQAKIEHLVDLRVGSFVQILATVNGNKTLILTKVDHNSYLEEEEFKEQSGLPLNQKVQKTALIIFEADEISEVKLTDSNNPISKYWWSDFLELEELNSSEKNTSSAFNSINKFLNQKVRKNSPSDYWALRNAVISYFRTHPAIAYDEMISSVFDGYQPDNHDLDIESIKEKISELPVKNNFDTQFDVTIEAIKAKIVDQIKLAQNLELKFTGEVDNLKEIISTGIGDNGRKFIRIYSDTGYENFKSD